MRALIVGHDQYRRSLAKSLGIGISELTVLTQLNNAGPLSPRRIAGVLGFTTGSTTAVLDRAEAAGFIVRTPNPADRRGLLIALTPAGQRAMTWMTSQLEARLTEALGGYSDDELADLTQAMTVIGITFEQAQADSFTVV